MNARPVHFVGSTGVREYFEPLKNLATRPSTRIYLGLIHFTDGLEGSMRRLRIAERFIRDFGVASECGFGRRDPQTIRDLLILHKAVATAQ